MQEEKKKLKFPQDFFNVKCIIFTIYIASLYWFAPRKNISLIILFVLFYFSINWYNYVYSCQYNYLINNISYTLLTILLLKYLPQKNKLILAFMLYVPYFILAWYDYITNCSFRMNPTIFPFGRFIYLPVKPDPYKRRYDELDPVIKANIANFDKYVVVSIIMGTIIYLIIKYLV